MTRQTGTIITIVVAVLTLCCSMTCCASGIITVASSGQWSDIFGTYIEWYHSLPVLCLGLMIWVIPLLLWLFLVRGKENAAL